jgi:hypothetical protein
LDAYRGSEDWPGYEASFYSLMTERQAEAVGHEIFDRYDNPCLLCSEPMPEHCHRRLVAELWAEHSPDLEIVHLI